MNKVAGKDIWHFTDSIPENYQRYLVPVLFEPYARDMAMRVAQTVHQGDVLETACGTGVLTRHLREMLPTEAGLIATDISAAMTNFAQSRLKGRGNVRWQTADASKLSFESSCFDAVVCQFGLMFVPDKGAAIREARRVLRDNGTLYFSVWDDPTMNPWAQIYDDIFQQFAKGSILPEEFKRPFSMSNRQELRQLLVDNGFHRIELETVAMEAVSQSALDWAIGAVIGTPRGQQLASAGVVLQPLIDALAHAITEQSKSTDVCKSMMSAIVVAAQVGV